MVSLRLAQESQERSIKVLELMAQQSATSAKDERIAESANAEIQRYVVAQQISLQEQKQKLETARETAELYKSGNSTLKKREVVEKVNRAVAESSNAIRILEEKTRVIVDFLSNETFSKSEIGALFSPGEYRLLPQQVRKGEQLFSPIVGKLYTFSDKYSTSFKELKGEIIVTGYSDATPIDAGSSLHRELSDLVQKDSGIAEPTSADLNQKLSELRAASIKSLLEKILRKREAARKESHLNVTVTILGRGEQIPKGLRADVFKNDPRRRVVTFYWVVLPAL